MYFNVCICNSGIILCLALCGSATSCGTMLDLGPTNCSSLGKLNAIQASPIEIVCFVVLADEMVPESYFLKLCLHIALSLSITMLIIFAVCGCNECAIMMLN